MCGADRTLTSLFENRVQPMRLAFFLCLLFLYGVCVSFPLSLSVSLSPIIEISLSCSFTADKPNH
ncbi:hypothetical protein BDW42DRAFT_166395 [Aspergillus taichungensis]|uniref:Uncharacterized protein n=1 Tax=Aspergillus taichungensis TaxID=482145 RepID=A0A2J5HYW9_9EURO|nr:hypothetical protein BDW42DRAFT_166395 [Aspergillus taichungensis]